MRTVKRKALLPNTNKQKALDELCQAYTLEKQYWLNGFRAWSLQSYLGKPRTIRDEMVKQKYRSPYGLQARHWKLAFEDAAETWDKYWQAIFVKVRSKIFYRKDLSERESHYAYWLLKGYPQFSLLMQGKSPKPSFFIEETFQRKVVGYVRRQVKQCKGKSPTVKKARTVRFDADCYDCYKHKGRQYIKLMSKRAGKRICIPLFGERAISGTITLVQSEEGINLHIPQDLKKKSSPKTSLEAVDFGYTEVMTDTQGIRYGRKFGKTLSKETQERHEKMQKRHKLHARERKKRVSVQARCLRKYNLGKKKLHSHIKRFQATSEREINTAINELIRTKKPSLLVTEDLRHPFHYDKPRIVNRRLSRWLRGKLQDRIEFKALAEGFRHEQVNPAYGSQSCPLCEFVDPGNRIKDRFQCQYCGHKDQVDKVAAMNYAKRIGDPEIGRYTPYRQVKTILLERFHRRVEGGQPLTVPGRTLDTAIGMYSPCLSKP